MLRLHDTTKKRIFIRRNKVLSSAAHYSPVGKRLEEKGIVGPHEGSKPRKVLVTKAQWYEMNAMSNAPGGEEAPSDPPFDVITEDSDD